jgi:glycosyltransferase involved in cell wall biosynthesis
MEATCKEFASLSHGSVQVSFIKPVPYGHPFFKALREYDVMLVPSLKEEQPRIIFDAYSQAMCVIGSDATGITELCRHKENALICKLGSAEDLAETIIYASQNKQQLIEMGINGLNSVKSKTHQKMHLDRELFLKKALKI